MVGVSKATIQNWLSGSHSPSMDSLSDLAFAAGVRLEWLVFGYGPQQRGPTLEELVEARADGHIAGPLYDQVFGHIMRLGDAEEWTLPPSLVSRLTDEIAALAQRYDDEAARDAIIDVMAELRLPQEWERLTAHQKLAAKAAAAKPEAPPKPD